MMDDGEDALEPEEQASNAALEAAERFLLAVANGDGRVVWELFSEDARAYVLNRALERGMDFDQGSRIRSGTASDEELDEYLSVLVEGLRRDLRGLDFARLAFESTADPVAPLKVEVTYLQQLSAPVGDVTPAIAAGSVILTLEGDDWKVERISPRQSR